MLGIGRHWIVCTSAMVLISRIARSTIGRTRTSATRPPFGTVNVTLTIERTPVSPEASARNGPPGAFATACCDVTIVAMFAEVVEHAWTGDVRVTPSWFRESTRLTAAE